MPNYSTYFGGAVWDGVLPPDFTSRWRTAITVPPQLANVSGMTGTNYYGKRAFRFDDTGATEQLYSWDRPDFLGDDVTDVDQLVLYYVESLPSFNMGINLCARCSGASGTENGYVLQHYQFSTTNELRLRTYTAGAGALSAQATIPAWTIQTWYWLQYRLEGDRHLARVWEYGTTPPHNWQLDFTEATYSAAGWNGPGATSGGDFWLDYYAVGTQGDAVELPFELSTVTNDNVITAYPSEIATDATSFLVYTGEPNVAVDWNLTGDGTLSVLTDYTDADGKAFARYTPGSIGTKTIDVTVGVPV